MKIGVYLRLFGRPGGAPEPPAWSLLRTAATAAEEVGFDRIVLEDALLYPDDDGNAGLWDPISIAAAIAAATTRIGISHAVLNNPYRHPALVARAAATLDEISGGRYSLGIGLGNTPADYPRFGIPADRRFSRFRESITVIRDLLRTGHAQLDGEFYSVPNGELVLRGPRPDGPPIVIAAGKPRMLRLTAELADEWNWWSTAPEQPDAMRDLVEQLDRACEEVGREPRSLRRSIDLFSITPPGPGGTTPPAIADVLLAFSGLGFDEVRVALTIPEPPAITQAIHAMAPVVELLHAA
jgi:alkanesulfonate monooxygenase SsuD/methylene tetrahydromethanopterin reductase-like flavin-dependent oxidoreductase (luciferase family)